MHINILLSFYRPTTFWQIRLIGSASFQITKAVSKIIELVYGFQNISNI